MQLQQDAARQKSDQMAKFEEQLKDVKTENEKLHEDIFEAEKRED